jgi:hypothetical protein
VRATCPAHLLDYLYLTKSTTYEAPHYAVFSNLLLYHLSSVPIFSSEPCSHIPSVFFPNIRDKVSCLYKITGKFIYPNSMRMLYNTSLLTEL